MANLQTFDALIDIFRNFLEKLKHVKVRSVCLEVTGFGDIFT